MAGDMLHTKSCSVACLIAVAVLVLEAVNSWSNVGNIAGWIYKSDRAVYKVHWTVSRSCGALYKPCSLLFTY